MRLAVIATVAVAAIGCRKPAARADVGGQDTPEASPEPVDAGAAEEPEEAVEDPGPEATADDAPADMEASRGPARISLGTQGVEAGPVVFKHRKHQKESECRKCHHEIQPGQTPSPCGSCHKEGAKSPDLQTSFHKTCTPCHGSLGLGPVKCAECHGWIKKKKQTP